MHADSERSDQRRIAPTPPPGRCLDDDDDGSGCPFANGINGTSKKHDARICRIACSSRSCVGSARVPRLELCQDTS